MPLLQPLPVPIHGQALACDMLYLCRSPELAIDEAHVLHTLA